MTEKEKAKVIEYRTLGFGYKKISRMTGVSVNTIKGFCRRNGMAGQAREEKPVDTGTRTCECCGKPIDVIPKRKPRRFCSDRCRNIWWNSHLELVNRKANYEYTCPTCGKRFTTYGNANRKYCSHECYIKDRFGGGSHE